LAVSWLSQTLGVDFPQACAVAAAVLIMYEADCIEKRRRPITFEHPLAN